MSDRGTHPGTAAAIDAPQLRALTVALSAGRLAIGAGLMAAPRRTLGALGFSGAGAETVAVARLAGARDLVLGGLAALSINDRDRLRAAVLSCAAADAGDAAIFAAALGEDDPRLRTAGMRGVCAAVPAALAGLWLARRLR